MENSIDINEELKSINQEMLLNKRIIDLEKAMESLIVFYSNYSIDNIADEVNNKICVLQNLDPQSDNGMISYNLLKNFFTISCEETKKIITSNIETVKNRLNTMNDQEYRNELNNISENIVNQVTNYYNSVIDDLKESIIQSNDYETIDKISKYIMTIITIKMITILQNNLNTYIKLIENNYEENNLIIQNINEKTRKVA